MGLTGTSVAEGGVAASPPSSAPATFYTAQGGNDIWWRAEAPARALGANLCVIPEERLDEEIGVVPSENRNEYFKWEIRQDPEDEERWWGYYPDHEGTAVWVRPDFPRATHIGNMREQGILTVSEVDDNYMANPNLNIFQRMSGFSKEGQRVHVRSLASTDRIIFSTHLLRDMYRNYLKNEFQCKTRDLPEAFVCRNNIDVADWPDPIPRENRLRVGWMGSPSHIHDVNLAYPALSNAKRLGCEVVMIGYDPREPRGSQYGESWENQTKGSKENIRKWKEVGFTHIPWKPPTENQYHREALPLDIGLCPLLTNESTLGKSDCKALEYGISGAAVVAWNNKVYNQTLIDKETALLVNSEREMTEAVAALALDERVRMYLANNLRQYIYEERGLKQMQAEWGAAVST